MVLSIPSLPDENYVCADCGISYSDVSNEEALRGIGTVPPSLRRLVANVNGEHLAHRPSSHSWSIIEYVCHLRDVFAVYTIRLHRTRTEEQPALEPMLNDLRARRFRYNNRSVGPVIDELEDNIGGLHHEAAKFKDPDWLRTATRLPGEVRTARWLLRQAMHEGVHHLRDIEQRL